MRRSLQEYVELVVFGLIALLVGTGLLWVVGWVLALGGIVLKSLAGLLWMLLRFIVPVAIAGGLVYFLVKAIQGRQGKDRATADARVDSDSVAAPAPVDPSYTPPAAGSVTTGVPVAGESTVDVPAATGGVTNGNIALGDDVDEVAGDVVPDPLSEGSAAVTVDDELADELEGELEGELEDELEDELADDLEDDDRDRA
ncbi:MAG TPA: hypothetical protein VFD39_05190 [Trueperaceae bacterium]|nr:hypothetical protein [Trueperaceae bacterium]